MIRRLALSLLALCFAGAAWGQSYRPGFGFSRPGFQFLSAGDVAAATTWDPADAPAGVWTLSGGNLVATKTGSGSVNSGRATSYRSTGKYYLEVTYSGSNSTRIGLANSASVNTAALGASTASVGYLTTGTVMFNNATQGTGLSLSAGDTLGIAVDLDARTIGWYRNGTLAYTSTTIPAGALAPAYGGNSASTGSVLTLSPTSFAFTPPSGYAAWGSP